MTVTRFTICKARIMTAFCGTEFPAEAECGIHFSFKMHNTAIILKVSLSFMQILIYSLHRNPLKLTFNFYPLDLSSYPSFCAVQATLSSSNEHGSFL